MLGCLFRVLYSYLLVCPVLVVSSVFWCGVLRACCCVGVMVVRAPCGAWVVRCLGWLCLRVVCCLACCGVQRCVCAFCWVGWQRRCVFVVCCVASPCVLLCFSIGVAWVGLCCALCGVVSRVRVGVAQRFVVWLVVCVVGLWCVYSVYCYDACAMMWGGD